MTKFIIAVVMFWANPADIPFNDAIELSTYKGKPLYFKTKTECIKYVDDNLQLLKDFGHASYPTADAVKTIYCVERVSS